MTVNFSRIHRAERMECPFIVSKRAASRQKPSTGIPFLRPNYSCHYTCGFLERAYSLSSRAVSVQPRDPAGFVPLFFPLPLPFFFLPPFLSFFLRLFFFFSPFLKQRPPHVRLCGSGFQIWLGSRGCNFVIHKRLSYGACSSSMYGEKPRLPLLPLDAFASRFVATVAFLRVFYHICKTDYLIQASPPLVEHSRKSGN